MRLAKVWDVFGGLEWSSGQGLSHELAPPLEACMVWRRGVPSRLRGCRGLRPLRNGGLAPLTGPSVVPCPEADPGGATGFPLKHRPLAGHGDPDPAEVSTALSLTPRPLPSCLGSTCLFWCLSSVPHPLLCLFLSPPPHPPHPLAPSPPHLAQAMPKPPARRPPPSPASLAACHRPQAPSLTACPCFVSPPVTPSPPWVGKKDQSW